MPSLTLRSLGVSHAVEGLRESGVEGRRLCAALAVEVGEAAAGLQLAQPATVGAAIDAVIVDRKAMTREALRDWLGAWVARERGASAAWDDPAADPAGVDTLRFPDLGG